LAAFLAAGIGAFAMGLFVLLSEAGIFTAPSLYGPAGGVSGRTTFAVVTWLIAWALVHRRWKGRHVEPASVWAVTLALFAFALLATFPPVWAIFG
jgi:multisubunit Na+/H+ antiporter MnhG subunit